MIYFLFHLCGHEMQNPAWKEMGGRFKKQKEEGKFINPSGNRYLSKHQSLRRADRAGRGGSKDMPRNREQDAQSDEEGDRRGDVKLDRCLSVLGCTLCIDTDLLIRSLLSPSNCCSEPSLCLFSCSVYFTVLCLWSLPALEWWLSVFGCFVGLPYIQVFLVLLISLGKERCRIRKISQCSIRWILNKINSQSRL